MSADIKETSLLKTSWSLVLALVILITAAYAVTEYDNTLAKCSTVDCQDAKLNDKINTVKAMLFLKISSDLSTTLKKRISSIEDDHKGLMISTSIIIELRSLKDELKKAEEEEAYWSNIVLNSQSNDK